MNTLKLKTLCVAGLFGLAATSMAAVQQGDWELNFSGSYSNSDVDLSDPDINSDSDTLTIGGTAGYFFTENWQFSGTARYVMNDVGDSDTDSLDIGLGVDYHFMPTERLVPYVGVGGYYSKINAAELDEDDLVYEIRAGVKQFVVDNIAVRYQVAWNQGEDIESLNASVGLSTFF